MSNGTYSVTHKKILESGKKLFLKNGYERTNLRELCKAAGVTTGAFYRHFDDKSAIFCELVDEAANGLLSKFDMAQEKCFDNIDVGNVDEIWNISLGAITEFIHYIYLHFDAFKLILCCSDGTKYNDYIDRLVERELSSTYRMFEVLDKKKSPYHHVADNELHMIIHAYYACLFETVLHDFDKEVALDSVQSLYVFFTAGWRKLLQI